MLTPVPSAWWPQMDKEVNMLKAAMETNKVGAGGWRPRRPGAPRLPLLALRPWPRPYVPHSLTELCV